MTTRCCIDPLKCLMRQIKIHSITNFDPFYCLAQVRMRGFDQKVIVIGHQSIGMHLDRIALHCLPQIFKEFSPVVFGFE